MTLLDLVAYPIFLNFIPSNVLHRMKATPILSFYL